ncbi:Protein of unknown function [Yoonia tamlensis]|uniref:Twitching motility protein PilT n=1 Tax=Yoonia tamlensis TaxID=390270 RepID=A0A1I6FXS5_9RHOB|nr:DUF1761 domain-containing protein [Yoonia tamlensis]SFR34700.1 Protein of unknown function [Yoonia tamlensis]
MGELTTNVNFIAVIVGAILSFIAGWAWYSPMLFGTKWAEGSGVKLGTANDMPLAAMASQAIGLLLMSWFVGVTAAHEMLATVILATLGFAVLAYSGNTFSGKTAYARNVDAGYWIAALVVMIIVQGVL